MFLQFFSFFDLFQIPTKFYFNGRSKQYSLIGLFISFGIYGYIIFSFLNSDLFQKNQPIVVNENYKTTQAETIEFLPENELKFAVADYFGKRYYDPSIFTFFVRYFYNATNYIEKELQICAERYNGNEMGSDFSNTFCLANSSFTISGSLDDSHLSYLAITMAPCNNQTSNNTCKSNEEIKKFIDTYPLTKYFTLRYQNNRIDSNDYENPFKNNTDVQSQYLDSRVQRTWNLYFKNAYIDNDDGWFLPSSNISKQFQLDIKDPDFRLRSSDTDAFMKIIFFASKEKLILKRRYQKLPEVVAEIFGIAHIIIFCCGVITKIVIYTSTLNQVLSNIYVFPKIKKRKKRKKLNKKKKQETEKKVSKSDKESNFDKEAQYDKDYQNTIIKLKPLEIEKKFIIEKDFETTQKKNTKEIFMANEKPENVMFTIEMSKTDPQTDKKLDKIFSNYCDHLPPKILKEDSLFEESLEGSKEKKEDDIINTKIPKEDTILNAKIPEKTEHNENEIKKEDIKAKQSFSVQAQSSLNKSNSRLNRVFSYFKRSNQGQNHYQRFNVSFLEYLWYAFCKGVKWISKKELSPTHQVIEQAEKNFRKSMDSMNIVKTFHDLEKLKMLVLNEDQLVLFNFLTKPVLVPSNENILDLKKIQNSQIRMTHLIKKQSECNVENTCFKMAYQRVQSNLEKNEINERLIQLLDNAIQKF